MRVIAGSARGRKFSAPATGARPTGDRVREAMFDVVAHLGGVDGAVVLDLFAGSGALGIEALSRGAESATFVDRDRGAVEAIRRNLAAVGLGEGARLVCADALAYCTDAQACDVVFCDPPYRFDRWAELLDVVPGELLVLESARPLELPDHLAAYRHYRYGGTLVTVANRREAGERRLDGDRGTGR